jgi:hypothetical protein
VKIVVKQLGEEVTNGFVMTIVETCLIITLMPRPIIWSEELICFYAKTEEYWRRFLQEKKK